MRELDTVDKAIRFGCGFFLGFGLVLGRFTCHRFPYHPELALGIPACVGVIVGVIAVRWRSG